VGRRTWERPGDGEERASERGEGERAQSRKPPAREVIYIHAVMMVI
jgi:hypothetical protein